MFLIYLLLQVSNKSLSSLLDEVPNVIITTLQFLISEISVVI